MTTGIHEPWIHQLSDFLDGDLDADSRGAVEAHLAGCSSCRGVLEELRLVVSQARALSDEGPSRDLWPGIAAAIEAPATAGAGPQRKETSVIALPTARAPEPRPEGLYLTVRQLIAASVVLAVVSAAVTWWAGPGLALDGAAAGGAGVAPSFVSPVSEPLESTAPPPELAQELSELQRVLTEARGRLEPNTLRILEKNLGVIQRAIDESVQALSVDPQNAYLRDHLDDAYREKATYLREAVTIIQWSGDA